MGQHPHAGFETVTIAYQGSVEHRDSFGNSGLNNPGDVQWMTAGAGIVHEEKHSQKFSEEGGDFEMVQLWVNLPAKFKKSRPGYQSILSDEIPKIELGKGAYVRIIAGELNGVKGPAKTFTPVNVFDVRIETGGKSEINLPSGNHSAIVLLRGDIELNGSTSLSGIGKIAGLSDTGELIQIEAKLESLILILTGEPIYEPIFSHGPFVMNTEEEIRQLFLDYQSGKMGHLN